MLVAESNDIIAPSEIIDLNMPNTRGAHTLFFKGDKTFWHDRTSEVSAFKTCHPQPSHCLDHFLLPPARTSRDGGL